MHYWKGILFLRYIFQSVMYRLCIYAQLWISYFCFESVWIRHVIFSLGKYYHKSYCCVFIKGKVSESYTCEISINIQVRGNGVALCWLWKFLSYAYFVTWKQTCQQIHVRKIMTWQMCIQTLLNQQKNTICCVHFRLSRSLFFNIWRVAGIFSWIWNAKVA